MAERREDDNRGGFAISYFVGRKYGLWATGSDRFTTAEMAEAARRDLGAAEARCSATHYTTRVIPASSRLTSEPTPTKREGVMA